MLKLFLTLFSCTLIATVYSREICYGDLGCFTDSPPFSLTLQRPIAVLPDTPTKIATKFNLYTRKNTNAAQVITADNLGTFYDALLPTKFIIHGFLDNANKPWVIEMKDAILKVDNVNVIAVDWSGGNSFPYTQATANTQVVGAEVAKLIKSMVAKKNAKLADFHLIGHSLGAHTSGYAGNRTPGIGRITGLDPAGPYFDGTDPIVRLDPTDAIYVDNIHTDGSNLLQLGFGTLQAMGHADFYPNGGREQPDCPASSIKLLNAVFNLVTFDVSGAENSLACSHSAATALFTDTINSRTCKYNAYQCQSKSDFDNGNCISCSARGCNRMGYYSSSNNDRGLLQLNTQSLAKTSVYCRQNYQVRLNSNNVNGLSSAKGTFTIFLRSATQTSSVEVIDNADNTFKPDTTEIRLLSLNNPINDDVQKVFISYKRTGNILISWLYDSQWSFRYVELLNGETQRLTRYCAATPNLILDNGVSGEFVKC